MTSIAVGLLEDERPQAELLRSWLEPAGYAVTHCETGAAFLAHLGGQQPDILILDWQLPDCEGIDILQQLRQDLGYGGPVLFATAKDSEEDIVRGLTMGADDYMIKPLRKAELLARLSALWRRSTGGQSSEVLTLGPIRLDLAGRLAEVDGQPVKLTSTEFDLAACVLSNVDQLLSRDFLLREVWGIDASLETRTVDMHISRVRKLLQIGPNMGYCIKTVYRHGYRLEQL